MKLNIKEDKNNENIKDLDKLKLKSNYLDFEESLKLIDDICEVHTVKQRKFYGKMYMV